MNIAKLIQEIAILGPPFLLALTVHEVSHGYVAYRLGDPTAKSQGRLTLNPLKHLDPIGTICFFIMKIGWAKPVPINPAYFKNPQRDTLWVSLAGPGANLLLAVASALIIKLIILLSPFLPRYFILPFGIMLEASVWINIILAIFNLIPIPPLDGSKILLNLLPHDLAVAFAKMERFGFIILLVLFYTGTIQKIILPIISFAHSILAG